MRTASSQNSAKDKVRKMNKIIFWISMRVYIMIMYGTAAVWALAIGILLIMVSGVLIASVLAPTHTVLPHVPIVRGQP
jgi:hypothetical protein